MQHRRLVRALAIPLALTFLAAACGGSDDDSSSDDSSPGAEETTAPDATDDDTPPATVADVDTSIVADTESVRSYGGDIVYGLEAEAVGLRPWEDACGEPCLNIHVSIFDTVMRQSAEGTYEGWLASSMEPNEDFTVWTGTLRPDVTFHNGVPLTAQTIVDMFAIQQTGTITAGLIKGATLTGVEATGDMEVTYTLSAGNSAFPAVLSGAVGRVFEPGAAADPATFTTDPVGTGPFMINKRDIDNETIVVRNENYWLSDQEGNQLPYLDSITFKPIPDEGTRLDALLSGTVNMMQSLRQGTVRDARNAGDSITLYEFQGNNTGGGMFNTAVPPYDDIRVRTGLNLMNDQPRVIEALGGTGISLPSTQWFSPDSPWYTEEAADAWTTFDFEAGVAELQSYIDDPARSDGKAPGEKIDVELSCPPDPTLIAAMQVLEQVWTGSELVNLTLTQFDQATHINNAVNDAHKAHCWRWSSNQDPSIALNPFLAPPEESVSNFPNFFDQQAYDWAQEAIQTDDFETRKGLYQDIMLSIAKNQQIWYSGYTATVVATENGILGINGWTLPEADANVTSAQLGDGFPNAVVSFQEVFFEQ